MDGLFKKTMGYLAQEGAAPQDEFVGKIVEVASIKLKIVSKIAEGELFCNFLPAALVPPDSDFATATSGKR